MNGRLKIMCVVGTRPEGIKMAPVVNELRRFSDQVEPILVSSGQHREMLAQALQPFGLVPDYDLDIMKQGQTLTDVTTRTLEGLQSLIHDVQPQAILAQGDTTTVFAAAVASFYHGLPFGHIEAGLRTTDIRNPFPEEFNRRVAGLVGKWHFCPTELSATNLRSEGKLDSDIFVTGNTGIDAVMEIAAQDAAAVEQEKLVLLTTHRRENWGEPQRQIAQAFRRLLDAHPEYKGVVAMHRNPAVREVLRSVLGDHPRVSLIEPPDYADFIHLIRRSKLILTDSGGVQEEAPSFGIPVLVLRETTERPEGVYAGTARLVGTEEEAVFQAANTLLSSEDEFLKMTNAVSPYGDGKASARVRFHLLKSFGIETPSVAPVFGSMGTSRFEPEGTGV